VIVGVGVGGLCTSCPVGIKRVHWEIDGVRINLLDGMWAPIPLIH
jgi:hypothetical protein